MTGRRGVADVASVVSAGGVSADCEGRDQGYGAHHGRRHHRQPAAHAAEGTAARIDRGAWEVPPLFQWLQRAGDVPVDDMLRTFNMGIGLILVCPPALVDPVLDDLRARHESPRRDRRNHPRRPQLSTTHEKGVGSVSKKLRSSRRARKNCDQSTVVTARASARTEVAQESLDFSRLLPANWRYRARNRCSHSGEWPQARRPFGAD